MILSYESWAMVAVILLFQYGLGRKGMLIDRLAKKSYDFFLDPETKIDKRERTKKLCRTVFGVLLVFACFFIAHIVLAIFLLIKVPVIFGAYVLLDFTVFGIGHRASNIQIANLTKENNDLKSRLSVMEPLHDMGVL